MGPEPGTRRSEGGQGPRSISKTTTTRPSTCDRHLTDDQLSHLQEVDVRLEAIASASARIWAGELDADTAGAVARLAQHAHLHLLAAT
jgi:hypothetical protein